MNDLGVPYLAAYDPAVSHGFSQATMMPSFAAALSSESAGTSRQTGQAAYRQQLIPTDPLSASTSTPTSPAGHQGSKSPPARHSQITLTSCANCGTQSTPLWRRNRNGQSICNAWCVGIPLLEDTNRMGSNSRSRVAVGCTRNLEMDLGPWLLVLSLPDLPHAHVPKPP